MHIKHYLKIFIFYTLNIFISKDKINKIFSKDNLAVNYPKEYYDQMIKPNSWELIPLGLRLFHPSKQNVINSNKHGFRCDEFLNKDNKDIVIITGGSAAWGLGASNDNKIFSNLLEEIINLKFKNYKVYNLSMMAATIQHELLYFIFWGLKLNPKILISFSGFNDLTLPPNYYDNKNKVFIYPETLNYQKNYDRLYGAESTIINRLFNIFKKPISNLKDNAVAINIKDRSENFNEKNNLFINLSKIYNFKYFSILQPIGYNKLKTPNEERQLNYFLTKHSSYKSYKDTFDFCKQNKKLYKHILDLTNYKNLHNFENIFDREKKEIFLDGIVHLNDLGNKIIADEIFNIIKKDL